MSPLRQKGHPDSAMGRDFLPHILKPLGFLTTTPPGNSQSANCPIPWKTIDCRSPRGCGFILERPLHRHCSVSCAQVRPSLVQSLQSEAQVPWRLEASQQVSPVPPHLPSLFPHLGFQVQSLLVALVMLVVAALQMQHLHFPLVVFPLKAFPWVASLLRF